MSLARPKAAAKVAISLCYLASMAIVGVARRLGGRPPPPRLTVLYYHGVPARHARRFAGQMNALDRWTRVVPACHRGALPANGNHVAITFDDAFVSVAENALGELAARRFPCTIFVPAGALGHSPPWEMEDNSGEREEVVMTEEQVRQLPSDLVTLGSHSMTHPRLSQIDKDHARCEIEASRRLLTALAGRDVRTLAFPYGDHDASVVELCRAAGYDTVFTVVPRRVNTLAPGMVRGRTKVEPSDGRLEFFLKFNGAYDWMPRASLLKRKLRSLYQRAVGSS